MRWFPTISAMPIHSTLLLTCVDNKLYHAIWNYVPDKLTYGTYDLLYTGIFENALRIMNCKWNDNLHGATS